MPTGTIGGGDVCAILHGLRPVFASTIASARMAQSPHWRALRRHHFLSDIGDKSAVLSSRNRFSFEGNCKPERRTFSLSRFRSDAATIPLDDTPTDRKAHTCAGIFVPAMQPF
jgi:hypothetical protein